MISKKSRKVVAALLIGATVCASGTFAYFNSKANMSDFMTTDAARQLSITNGHVEISGKINGSETIGGYWSYNVSTLSDPALKGYEQENASPDILSGGKHLTLSNDNAITLADNTELKRTKIGAGFASGVITNARPGDAIVLGDSSNADNEGLVIVNKSNLTTKIQLRFKRDAAGSDTEAIKEFNKLLAAGWKFYLNDTNYATADELKAALETTKYYAPASVPEGTTKPNEPANPKPNPGESVEVYNQRTGSSLENQEAVTKLEGEWTKYEEDLKKYNDALAKTNSVATIKMRLELPIITGNDQKDKELATGKDGAFDLDNLFEIIATQENNPQWNQAGTGLYD